ncbi:hypothetical protein F511_43574 [Dorcoceras hygrometricum]|uniref:Uncharacterized protein n=1 Tax=Dorcoceras hygrometricum TaxID=472368 RepID=A0A2Z7ANJ9_9LAMI|nr:hypothetical protein F511_43574 [Dorcoceras hygrometricum]
MPRPPCARICAQRRPTSCSHLREVGWPWPATMRGQRAWRCARCGARDGPPREAVASRDTASRGPTTIVAPESEFRTCPTDHGIQLAVGPQPLWLRNQNSGLAQRIMVRASSNITP